MVTDREAIGESTKLELDEIEACGVNDSDRLGKAATGKFICSKNKRVVNPFPSGVALVNIATK